MELGLFLVFGLGVVVGVILTFSVQSIFKAKPITVVHCTSDLDAPAREALKKQYEEATGGKVVVTAEVLDTKTIVAAR